MVEIPSEALRWIYFAVVPVILLLAAGFFIFCLNFFLSEKIPIRKKIFENICNSLKKKEIRKKVYPYCIIIKYLFIFSWIPLTFLVLPPVLINYVAEINYGIYVLLLFFLTPSHFWVLAFYLAKIPFKILNPDLDSELLLYASFFYSNRNESSFVFRYDVKKFCFYYLLVSTVLMVSIFLFLKFG